MSMGLLFVYLLVLLNIALTIWLNIRGGKAGISNNFLQNQFREERGSNAESARLLREELARSQAQNSETMLKTLQTLGETQDKRLKELQDGFGQLRDRNEKKLEEIRNTMDEQLKGTSETLENTLRAMSETQHNRLKEMQQEIGTLSDRNEQRIGKLTDKIEGQLKEMRTSNEQKIEEMRKTVDEQLQGTSEVLQNTLKAMSETQQTRLKEMQQGIDSLSNRNEHRIGKLTDKIDQQLKELRDSNEQKLEKMRETVDEKLQGTLEKRLGESFKLVSERLEAVQKGLGEMQELATGVGDLKAVLSNVKTRGTWGEIQLGALLEQILSRSQYVQNAKPKPGSDAIVEFAIKLPGKQDSEQSEVLLPIDAKFPQEDYNRLLDASEKGDSEEAQKSVAALLRAVEGSAKDIREKYISPPHTTDFAILYLPTEGLYAEVVRSPDMLDRLQGRYRIVVAGPTTLAAILNSLQMGFKTLAIEKRSSEVWTVLSAVKLEFGKFGDVLDKVKRQIGTVSKSLEDTDVRRRAMARRLRDVEQLPADQDPAEIIGLQDFSEDDTLSGEQE